ncbi:MAG: hypothetical protein J0I47_00710 [Sphingomonas sp.]|uniref:hypothetical protein n=1 Tax=Sphingomonas sp. TaxID=28214 RepID=UPI001AC3A25A|nr:hypothetical protein [Sphingomonas sp.]MBN8806750.1 hypothetical protein [Sphingomonas sp.]
MKRIRVVAAILALLTATMAGLFWLVPGIGMETIAGCGVAALCLLIVVPFDASEPPARKRVLAACVAFVVAVGVALGFAIETSVDLGPLSALAGVEFVGLILAVWSFTVRNRRRRALWSDYYDR